MSAIGFVLSVCAIVVFVWILLIPDVVTRMLRKNGWIRERRFALLPLLLCVPAIMVPFYLHKWQHDPPVGTYIAIMGLGAACVTMVLKDPSSVEKGAWVLVFTIITFAEINNLYLAEKKQIAQFGAITSGLNAANSALGKTNEDIQLTGEGLQQTLDNLVAFRGETTGGDSVLWFEPTTVMEIGKNAGGIEEGSVLFQAFPQVLGKYPLPVAHVEAFGPNGWLIGGGSEKLNPAIEYRNFRPNELARSRQGVAVFIRPTKTPMVIRIFINLSSGSYFQNVRLEKINGKWEWGSRLFKGTSKTPRHEDKSSGFPKQLLDE